MSRIEGGLMKVDLNSNAKRPDPPRGCRIHAESVVRGKGCTALYG